MDTSPSSPDGSDDPAATPPEQPRKRFSKLVGAIPVMATTVAAVVAILTGVIGLLAGLHLHTAHPAPVSARFTAPAQDEQE